VPDVPLHCSAKLFFSIWRKTDQYESIADSVAVGTNNRGLRRGGYK
jgi:hypothetical protein